MSDKESIHPNLFAGLVDTRTDEYGGKLAYADNLGIAVRHLYRLERGETPLTSKAGRRVLEDLELSVDDARTLASIGMRQACEIVLAQNDPADFDSDTAKINARFMDLVKDRGSAIPSSAFVIFLTGDKHAKQALLELLQQVESEASEVENEASGHTLSPRQTAIMELLLQGSTNQEIANSLGVQLQTVKNTLSTIYEKMGVSNRTGAVVKYQESFGRNTTD